jgi:hypothetical protein
MLNILAQAVADPSTPAWATSTIGVLVGIVAILAFIHTVVMPAVNAAAADAAAAKAAFTAQSTALAATDATANQALATASAAHATAAVAVAGVNTINAAANAAGPAVMPQLALPAPVATQTAAAAH